MTAHITDHVPTAASLRTPIEAPERTCEVYEKSLPAGHMLHPGCDARWLKPTSAARGFVRNDQVESDKTAPAKRELDEGLTPTSESTGEGLT